MNEEHEGKSHHILWVFAPIGALLLSVLSIGPVALIASRAGANGAGIRQFYAPVIWLHEHSVLRKPLDLYLDLWGVH